MSIKPVAFIDDAGLYALTHNAAAKVWPVPADKEASIYAIPDTHRVVSVELLHDIETDLIMEITNIGRLQAIRAIIEEKP